VPAQVQPFFSIVVPVFNRQRLVRRAVASCLTQRHPAFEVIVVDDGSRDGTASAVREMADHRLRLIVLPDNRGVSVARNRGVREARGDWVVCLDSDDELMPDALSLMDREIRVLPEAIGACRFMCRLDDDGCSPHPPLVREVWDYAKYLAWAEQSIGHPQDTALCVRRRTFDVVQYPDGRALEAIYHMDFAVRFLTATSPAVVLRIRSDADNRLTQPDTARALVAAADVARSFEMLLQRHRAALEAGAPRLLAQYVRGLATQQFLSGDRRGGLATIAGSIRARQAPLGATLAMALFGLCGPSVLARMQALRASGWSWSRAARSAP
jgi:glycosyltransferase involved in cell wall biosynthesis